MKLMHRIGASAVLWIAMGIGCGGAGVDPARATSIAGLSCNASSGQALFSSQCAPCHGADGLGGNPGPNLAGRSQSVVIDTALSGKDQMPSFAALSDQNIADIAAFVATIR